jgi:hypothetical protein
MSIDSKQFRYFVRVEEGQHFWRRAERLRIGDGEILAATAPSVGAGTDPEEPADYRLDGH